MTRAEVEAYVLMFEKARRKHGLSIAIETIILEERFGKKQRSAVPVSPELEQACQQIVSEVARVHGVTVSELRGEVEADRRDQVKAAQQEACWRLHKIGRPFEVIARLTGMSVSAAFARQRAFRARMVRDPILRRRMGVDEELRRKPVARRRAGGRPARAALSGSK